MKTLYPAIQPYREYTLAVDALHTLHIEEVGNPQGIPVVLLHGGPGAGAKPEHRCMFNPEVYRMILFDQRGAGRSTPRGELQQNTVEHLCADLEKIRQHCQVEQWMIFGSSWGSTLALFYAQRYPERVRYLFLRSVFLFREVDLAWHLANAGAIYPEAWQLFIEHLPAQQRQAVVQGYYDLLFSDDELVSMAAAKAWLRWSSICCLAPGESLEESKLAITNLTLARIEVHYLQHNSFAKTTGVLSRPQALSSIPGSIVHGRYDLLCPIEGAFALQKAWPTSQLVIVPGAGHAGGHPAMVDAVINLSDQLAELVRLN